MLYLTYRKAKVNGITGSSRIGRAYKTQESAIRLAERFSNSYVSSYPGGKIIFSKNEDKSCM